MYANKIYLVDRGPDLASPFMGVFMPTLYWAILSPSFCVGGPCAPWFGTDWGWADGWDWEAGTWHSNSDRGRYGYQDPSYYNQVFLFPSTTQPPPTSYIQGRRRLQKAFVGAGSEVGISSSGDSWVGPIPGSGRPVRSRAQMLAAVGAARAYGRHVRYQIRTAAAAARAKAESFMPPMDTGSMPADTDGVAAMAAAAAAVTPNILHPDFIQSAAAYAASRNHSSDKHWLDAAKAASNATVSVAAATADRNISAAFFASGGWNTNNFLWQGWGMNYYYFDYYQWWREHYFLRNMYMNLRIPPKVNPCK